MNKFERLQELVSHWNQYYKEQYGWESASSLDSYVAALLSSPHVDLRLEHLKLMNHRLPFDCDGCYILVTGISRKHYTDFFGWNYLDMCIFFYESVLPYFTSLTRTFNTSGLALIDSQGLDRYIVCIISKPIRYEDVLSLSDKLTAFLQSEYEARLFGADRRVKCFSVLSREVSHRLELMNHYLEATRLKEMAFFRMQPMVFLPDSYEKEHSRINNVVLSDFKASYSTAVYRGSAEEAATHLRMLFLNKLKFAFDFWAVDLALHYCWDILYTACTTYSGQYSSEFERSSFCSIEECCDFLIQETAAVCRIILDSGHNLSYISREALYYIHTHYHEPISLKDIAGYVNVVPSYISRVFRREMGESLVKYINSLRIENAKALLENTGDKIKSIAEQVGIPNIKYFSRLFREHVGMTPQEYRNQH